MLTQRRAPVPSREHCVLLARGRAHVEGSHGGGRQRGTAALRAGSRAREAVTAAAPGQAESEKSSHCIRKVFSLSLHGWHTDTGFLSNKGFEIG